MFYIDRSTESATGCESGAVRAPIYVQHFNCCPGFMPPYWQSHSKGK